MHRTLGRIAATAATVVAIAAAGVLSARAASAGAAAGGSPPTVEVALTGKTVSIPRTIAAGAVSLSVTTTGAKDGEVGLVRLDPGVTIGQAFALVNAHHGDPNALIGHASIVADIDAPRGAAAIAETVLAPGHYAAINFASHGRPPLALFTVTRSSHPATLPKPAATIKEEEFRFVGPSTLRDGELVRFENAGYLTHMTVAASFKSPADARRAMALLKAGEDGPAQKLARGLVSFMDTNSPGAMQQERITAKPGTYVMACFMTTEDGREHTTLGMLKMVKVTR